MPTLNKTIEDIGTEHGRLDGLIAAAGIQQETPALEYTAEDANRMFEVNITGVFMTAQAAAKQMIRYGNGGSIVMIASMSGTVANRVWPILFHVSFSYLTNSTGPHLSGI
jgi:NAD(P)-dependent dehydrogenase (short-subunit alcohol dehydrogenase family)